MRDSETTVEKTVRRFEAPTGQLRYLHNISHRGRPYRLQQEWQIEEHVKIGASHLAPKFSAEWRDVPCVDEGADA